MSIDLKSEPNYPFMIYITEEMANELLSSTRKNTKEIAKAIRETNKTVHLEIKTPVTLNITQKKFGVSAENVMAYIEGGDLKDEVIVLSAHYDHLGIIDGKVYNGADDDGSGTVAVMEIAKAFQNAKKAGNGPKRSILFLHVTGEEHGLFGSEYYSDNPVFPLRPQPIQKRRTRT